MNNKHKRQKRVNKIYKYNDTHRLYEADVTLEPEFIELQTRFNELEGYYNSLKIKDRENVNKLALLQNVQEENEQLKLEIEKGLEQYIAALLMV